MSCQLIVSNPCGVVGVKERSVAYVAWMLGVGGSIGDKFYSGQIQQCKQIRLVCGGTANLANFQAKRGPVGLDDQPSDTSVTTVGWSVGIGMTAIKHDSSLVFLASL